MPLCAAAAIAPAARPVHACAPADRAPSPVADEGRTAAEWPSGEKFDSSYDRGTPTSFAPNQVIKGWTEAMQLMVEGDKWELYIPSDLAYGDRGRPPKIGGGGPRRAPPPSEPAARRLA